MSYVKGCSPAFKKRLDADFARITGSLLSLPEARGFSAIFLMGGYGRGEGTALQKEGAEEPFNDYDLLVVGRSRSRCKTRAIRRQLKEKAELLSCQIGLPVDLSFQPLSALKKAEPSLMNIELKRGHTLLWGSEGVLDRMPDYGFDEMPLSEGTRLMMNRGALLLREKRDFKGPLKAILALGDSLLILYRAYSPFYSEKSGRIRAFFGKSGIPHVDWIVERYLKGALFKLSGEPSPLLSWEQEAFHKELKRRFLDFFLWYEAERLGSSPFGISGYCSLLEKSPKSIKGALLEALLFGFQALKPSWRWTALHPRYRLFAALPALLAGEPCPLLDKLLAPRLDQSLLSRFEELRERLS